MLEKRDRHNLNTWMVCVNLVTNHLRKLPLCDQSPSGNKEKSEPLQTVPLCDQLLSR